MKKKYVLKSWVKEVLFYTGCILAMILLLMSINKMTNDAIEQCVAGGNDRGFCERELSK